MVDTYVAKRVHVERGHVLDSEWSGGSAKEVPAGVHERRLDDVGVVSVLRDFSSERLQVGEAQPSGRR